MGSNIRARLGSLETLPDSAILDICSDDLVDALRNAQIVSGIGVGV